MVKSYPSLLMGYILNHISDDFHYLMYIVRVVSLSHSFLFSNKYMSTCFVVYKKGLVLQVVLQVAEEEDLLQH